MISRNIRAAIFTFALSFLLFSSHEFNRARGQGATGSISGTVTDTSGAVVPNASIQVKNTGTGLTVSRMADAQGRYTAPDLALGTYDVSASAAGFTTAVRRGITVTVGAQLIADFSLQIGQQQQTVTVQGEVSQVETSSSTVSNLVEPTQMRELPLNGRNFEQLLLLAPGVSPSGAQTNTFYGTQSNYSIAGYRPEGQIFNLDNTDITGYWRHGTGSDATGNSLGVEAIAEFSTLTDTYSAQYGGAGAVINAVSKSGTNTVHGSLYEFLRNSAMDARNFFDKATPPPFRRNQFGGSVGGPIKKDKLFFFVNYEGLRQSLATTNIATVPACLPNCTITATNPVVASAIANILKLYPTPDTACPNGVFSCAADVATQPITENYLLGRVDYNMSEKDSIFLRYVFDLAQVTSPFSGSAVPLWPEIDHTNNEYVTLEERRIVSPTLVNLARFTLIMPRESVAEPDTHPAMQFFPGLGRPDGSLSITGYTGLGANALLPFYIDQARFTFADDAIVTKGAHSLKFGASLERIRDNTWAPFQWGGVWTFTSLPNFLNGTATQLTAGVPGEDDAYRDFRELIYAPYIQDEWKLSARLTLNLGLRWEPTADPSGANHPLNALQTIPYGTFTPTERIFAHNNSLRNWMPRIGLAFDPFKDHKTSIRAGFGMFDNLIESRIFAAAYELAPPWLSETQTNPVFPTPFSPAGGTTAPNSTQGVYYNTTNTPYVMQYNIMLQREIPGNGVFSVGYVGSRGVHLWGVVDLNAPLPTMVNGLETFATVVGTSTLVNNPRPNPALAQLPTQITTVESRYNSMQVSYNKRFSHNLQAQVSYTWSRSLDDGSATQGLENPGGVTGNAAFENPYNYMQDWGPSTFNRTNTARVSGVYVLPFKGNLFVEGWQFSGFYQYSSGSPFSAVDGFTWDWLTGAAGARPNVIAGCNLYPANQSIAEWFNPSCYTLQPGGTIGDTGRDTLIGPNFWDLDFAMMKNTPIRKISDAANLQFRAEFFNLLNHPSFGFPTNAVFTGGLTPNPTAGLITSVASTPRQIQLALKFIF